MRKELQKIESQRLKFFGQFSRYGEKWFKNHKTITILLKKIKNENGLIVTDHLWINETKGLQNLGELKEGDSIEFYARVKDYVKGYVNYRAEIDCRQKDYKLSHPTKIKKL